MTNSIFLLNEPCDRVAIHRSCLHIPVSSVSLCLTLYVFVNWLAGQAWTHNSCVPALCKGIIIDDYVQEAVHLCNCLLFRVIMPNSDVLSE